MTQKSRNSLLVSTGSFYPDQTGGPANTVYWITKGLVSKDVDVTVITSDRGIKQGIVFDKWLQTDYGNIIYLTTRHILFPWRVILKTIGSLPKFESVYIVSIFYTLSFIIAPIAVLLGKKVIWSPRGELLPTALAFNSLSKKFVLFLVRLIKNRVVFHVTSTEEHIQIKHLLGEKTKVVELPLIIDLPKQYKRQPENCILYVGRIHPIKALENLIQSLALSKQFMESDYFLKIVGDGDADYTESLATTVTNLNLNEKVKFVGRLKGDEKYQAYADAYCMVLPSFSENFGAVVAEALSQGTPVIASKGTPWEILETYEAGIWTENTPTALAVSIDSLLSLSPSDYEIKRSNAYTLVEEKFGTRKNINGYVDMFFKPTFN